MLDQIIQDIVVNIVCKFATSIFNAIASRIKNWLFPMPIVGGEAEIDLLIPHALATDVILEIPYLLLVADDSGPDIENVSSSNCREFDGGIIAQAAGAGGLGRVSHWTLSFDEHPATIIKLAPKSIIFRFRIS
jgi:hypothetical protein